jgi:hypothetical protein
MESVFHKLLEAAEEMNLPEGEYLHATALLKRCFETSKTADTKRTTFGPETPIVLVLQGTSSQKDLTFTIQDATFTRQPRELPNGGTYNALIRTLRYTMQQGDEQAVEFNDPLETPYAEPLPSETLSFGKRLRQYTHRHRPFKMTLTLLGATTTETAQDWLMRDRLEDETWMGDDHDECYGYSEWLNGMPYEVESMIFGSWLASLR